MKIKIYKKVIVIVIGILLIFLSLVKNGEKYVRDTGNMICLDCIGLGGGRKRMYRNR